jgi:hypothetical protein
MENSPIKQFVAGLFFNFPGERAPKWIIGDLSIKKEEFIAWLNEQEVNEKGYVKVTVKMGKEKPYCELNTYRPSSQPWNQE